MKSVGWPTVEQMKLIDWIDHQSLSIIIVDQIFEHSYLKKRWLSASKEALLVELLLILSPYVVLFTGSRFRVHIWLGLNIAFTFMKDVFPVENYAALYRLFYSQASSFPSLGNRFLDFHSFVPINVSFSKFFTIKGIISVNTDPFLPFQFCS